MSVTSSPTATSITETPTVTTQYRVTYDSRTSCSVTVNVASNPVISDISYACNNNSNSDITLTATASNGTAPLQYSIDATNYQASHLFALTSAGDYTVTVKDANNCIATLATTVSLPTLTLDPSGNLTLQSGATSQVLNATSIDGISFVWSRNNTVITGESTSTYTVNIDETFINTTNTYAVYSIASNGCVSNTETLNLTVNETIILPTAIDITETGVANGNNIFAAQTGKELFVFNRYGVTVYEENVSDSNNMKGWNGCWNGEGGKEVDPGVYFYILTTDSQKLKGTIEVVKTK